MPTQNNVDPKQYFAFTEWVFEMQIPRVLGKANVNFGKWTLTDNYGVIVYFTTKELFTHFLANKTLTVICKQKKSNKQ